jgi:hypothetical protein
MENGGQWRPPDASIEERRFPMSRMIRSAVLALVLATLASAAAPALSFAGRSTPPRTPGFDAVWSWLGSLLVPAGPVASPSRPALSAKAGSQMDPNGRKATTISPVSATDAGSQMDPNGLK